MGRPVNDDLIKPWKISLPATLAGRLEFMLRDPIHNKPIYGARAILIEKLFEWWIARENGTNPDFLPEVPTLLQLRERANDA